MSNINQIVILSGKGGTGKTTVSGALAYLMKETVMVDCDVDASNLHIILNPTVGYKEEFSGGKQARITTDKCFGCGRCAKLCRFSAIKKEGMIYKVDGVLCEGCGVCSWNCPADAVVFEEQINGEYYISETEFGPFIHASLYAGEENSGKLVTLIKEKAVKKASEKNIKNIIIDGPPGIGCPVIASLTGAHASLVVTEPTVSGIHDLQRLCTLLSQMNTRTYICVNKADINEEKTSLIKKYAQENNYAFLGEIPFSEKLAKTLALGKNPMLCEDESVLKALENIRFRMEEED